MATYTATITQPDYVGNFAYELHCRGAYYALSSGVQDNAADFAIWNAAVNALDGLSNSTIASYSNGGVTTLVFTVDWDEINSDNIPTVIFDTGSGSPYTSSFVVSTLCPTCYDMVIEYCVDSLTMDIVLEAETDYYINIEDSLGNVYESLATSGVDGSITMISADFLSGNLLTPFSGILEVKFHLVGSTEFVNFTVGSITYSCINLTVKDVTTV